MALATIDVDRGIEFTCVDEGRSAQHEVGHRIARRSSTARRRLAREARSFEEVRVYMAKFDAADRQVRGVAVPDDVKRALRALMAASVESGGVLDIYDPAGMPKPSLADLNADFLARAQSAKNPTWPSRRCES